MTRAQALQEARRRWGSDGHAAVARYAHLRPTYHVGRKATRTGFARYRKNTLGRGDSWEAAFADADRREKKASR